MYMQKIVFLACLSSISYIHAQTTPVSALNSAQDVRARIVTSDGQPTEQLLNLLDFLKIKHNGTMFDITQRLATLCDTPWGQKYMSSLSLDAIRPLIDKLGLIDQIESVSQKQYKYAIVIDGWVGAMRCRLGELQRLWDSGVRFEKIIFFASQDALDPVMSSVQELCQVLPKAGIRKDWTFDAQAPYKTVYDAAKLVYDQADLQAQMRALPVVFVNAPAGIEWSLGVRADAWLATNPEPGDCVVVVNQPYVLWCATELKKSLPEGFKTVDVVGYAIGKRWHSIEMWLRALSQFLKQEYAPQTRSYFGDLFSDFFYDMDVYRSLDIQETEAQ